MNRRGFLKWMGLGAVTAAVAPHVVPTETAAAETAETALAAKKAAHPLLTMTRLPEMAGVTYNTPYIGSITPVELTEGANIDNALRVFVSHAQMIQEHQGVLANRLLANAMSYKHDNDQLASMASYSGGAPCVFTPARRTRDWSESVWQARVRADSARRRAVRDSQKARQNWREQWRAERLSRGVR